MATTDITPPGHLSRTEIRRGVQARLRAKARARLISALTSWPVGIALAVAAGLAAAQVLR
ncbi:hypothetical protein [Micromonospora sp. WMMD737]|uniref:hypothetical protein n=1 Tax=Micromonospora sp. WMMD737 TaxID=3404113 RepID=UPI003B931B07